MLYPLKFSPILVSKIWGGDKLSYKSKDPKKKENIGESWEISALQGDISVVSDGILAENDLQELVEIYMGDLVGDKVYEKFGLEFPLLIKYIDAQEDLSIQVHPNDELAKKRHKAYGKTEMWYVVDAEPDAKVVLGFKEKADLSDYIINLNNNTLPNILNSIDVDKGDCIFIPSGTIHAICKGCLMLEIQETSDITYRIFDYNRKDKDGNKRELHTDLAKEAIDFNQIKKSKISYNRHLNHFEELVKCEYFTTNILEFDKEIEQDYARIDSFVIYMCVEGEFTLVYEDEKFIKVKKGDTILIPACFDSVFLIPDKKSGKATVVESYIEL